MVIEIPLSKTGKHAGKFVAWIDEEDSPLAQFNWSVAIRKGVNYAVRAVQKDGEIQTIFLHQAVLERMTDGNLQRGDIADHVNLNGLDNTRGNIRRATKSQNQVNSKAHKDNALGVKGVHFSKETGKYVAMICVNGRRKHLGYYSLLEDAKKAYDQALIANFGKFGRV